MSRKFVEITPDWTYAMGFLHHNTCPKIDGVKIRGSFSVPQIGKCVLCEAPIPGQIIMLAQLQDIEGIGE